MFIRSNWSDRLFGVFNYAFLSVFALFCLLPFWILIVASFTDDLVLRQDGYLPWARQWSVEAYQWVIRGQDIQVGYQTSISLTFAGTAGAVAVMSALGYVMSIRRLKIRSKLALYVYFPMVFVPGLIPWFITCRRILHLTDTMWALILPMMVQPFWIFVFRNFFSRLPTEILESAYLDGASDFQMLYHIVLPLSTPVLATVALFMAIAYWNDWFLGVMLLDFASFHPLSVIILKMVNNIQALATAMKQPGVMINLSQLPTLSIRMATAVITIGPIILVYPFIQRYFIRGLTVGAINN